MSRRVTAACASACLLVLVVGTGCTIRYSQTMVGHVERVRPGAIMNSDGGVEVGLGIPGAGGGLAVIAFSEPMSAHEQLNAPCDVALGQIDYRGTWYAYYVAANFPEVEVRYYCVDERTMSGGSGR